MSFLSGLLHAERQRLGTRALTRSLGCFKQAVLVIRWLIDGTRISQLAGDNTISRSTGYAYLHEGLTVLAAQALGLHSVLLAAKARPTPSRWRSRSHATMAALVLLHHDHRRTT
ncbi:hypothetical protein PSN13_00045 [Micromonospora saelicesensis]|uniref:Uncharacterized protein n=1 Tax=Micromonospora saelicesensis TaxID=285676 RepID=A0A328NX60_9ACTN|nr:hypothetical protein PSN13_00045 [Micromonospora saelicesensis]